MAKSRIIKEIASQEISLEIALSRLMIIASDIDDMVLCNWAQNEINGYKENSEVPYYRIIGRGELVYSGINGSFQVTNIPLPIACLDEKELKIIDAYKFVQGIGTIEKIADSNNSAQRDVTSLAGGILERTGIQCVSISIHHSSGTFIDMLSCIRTKLLTIFIKLDKEFGCLDDLDIYHEKTNMNEIKNYIFNLIYHDSSTNIGNENKIDKSNFIDNRE